MSDISQFPKLHIYSDESSQTKHRYLVLGASVCDHDMAPRLAARIGVTIKRLGGTSELKWGKVKRRNLPMYKAAVDAYFDYQDRNFVGFFSLVVDTHKADHKSYNDGDREIGFSKYLFTLLFKFPRLWGASMQFYAFLDDRTTKHTPEATRRMLNAKARRLWKVQHDVFRQCQFLQSHRSRLIQITDVITGAIAFQTNGHDKAANAATYKIELAQHIAERARVETLALPTPYNHQRFDIWHLDFAKARPAI